jgi:malonyl-CoA/methylmalonyl-CoA synthetase
MTETGMLTSNRSTGEDRRDRRPAAAGSFRARRRCGAQSLRPGQVGCVEVRGPNVFSGYWRMPEKTREEFTDDGYFARATWGAAAERLSAHRRPREGRHHHGGLNVYPKEIEEKIDALPGVTESAVIGVPDADFGEAVAAIVVAEDGHPLTEPA